MAFHAVSCRRGDALLVSGLGFRLGPGEAALVTGPNGAGKSSLLRLAAGLLRPLVGRVERTGRLALADERSALDPALSLADALGFWARLDGASSAALTLALEAMDLAPLADIPVRLLSTGQRKRAALARTIAAGAEIWLLDEPGNGLDAAALDRLADAIADHRAGGGIILAATHQPLALPGALAIELAPQ